MEITRMLLAIMLLTIANVTADDSSLKRRVVFTNQGNFLLTMSRWTLVVDISFQEYDTQLVRMQEHVEELERITRIAQLATNYLVFWHYTAAEVENLKRELMELNAKYKDLKSLVTIDPTYRRKRSLIDVGGKVLKFLFGTAMSSDVEDLNGRIAHLETNQKGIVHILEAQASVLNETLVAVKDNWRHIKMILNREEILSKTVQSQSYSLLVNAALRYIESAVAEFRSQLTNLRVAIEISEQGRLSSYFVSRGTLLAALTDINSHLPSDVSLVEPVRPDNLFKYYQWITVTATAHLNTLRLFIDIPLRNPDQFFDLFEIVKFPVFFASANIFVYYRTDYNFIALSKNKQSYILLDTYEVLKCRSGAVSICAPETPIWKHPYQSCEYALFMGQDVAVKRLCKRRVTPTHPPVFRRLDDSGTWLYATNKPLSLVVECSRTRDTSEQSKVTKLIGTNIIKLNNSCKGYLPGIELTSHFQQRSTWKLTVGTSLVFPLLTDILNKTEVKLIQIYRNTTTHVDHVDRLPTDISLERAEITLRDIKSHVDRLDQSVSSQYPHETQHYYKEITLGITAFLLTMTFVLTCIYRKRMLEFCTRCVSDRGRGPMTSSLEATEATCSALPRASEKTDTTEVELGQAPERAEEIQLSSFDNKARTERSAELRVSSDLSLAPEKPLRI